jgi:two-component system sensor histidine kinase KdpD
MGVSRHRVRWSARAWAAGVVAPVAGTAIGLLLPHQGSAGAASVYMLAVAAAAWLGGLLAGLVAAPLAFVGLNYFFTPPHHTLKVASFEDAVALIVFLVVATMIGVLLARSLEERARAERREREALDMNRVTSAFLVPRPIQRTMADLAGVLVGSLSLARCAIDTAVGGEAVTVTVPTSSVETDRVGPAVEVPLSTATGSHGTLRATRREGADPFTTEDVALLRASAGQIAVALEKAALDEEVRRVRLEAEAITTRAALFSSVTHDLRTPLASIKASVTSLLESGDRYTPAQRTEFLETILEETDRLNRLVGNIVDLARLRAGALVPAKVPVGIEDVIEAVLARMRPLLRERTIRTIFRPNLPAVPLDPTYMDQAITNLLENAARFSPPGSEIVISASVWESWLEVRISDRGPGIPPGERERVFEEFYQQDRGPGRGGTGLGLAIARAVVSAHGGRIWVEGVAGGGTAVVFRFPLSARPDAAVAGPRR